MQLKQRESMTQITVPPSQKSVSSQMNARSQVDINEIQTAVENQLMSGPYKQLARAYIEYRHDRDIQRESVVV
ncbi:Anaerobic ribonucleoside-triphosphate reductase [Salmonella enterica subsp. enterica]|uniref:Anaerobic ribonucleoside-triphosphate reductase n=1 Tax=Salmonella enterica I TaxID=59201 RepID=A0A379X187_SALET|nr:Anaerobic ribonucleoside-triphosphate reductase [Salmonella enterica subsp. enterica]